jgi:uncharacterized protein (TIGR02302 family)
MPATVEPVLVDPVFAGDALGSWAVRRALWGTWLGLLAEAFWRAYWPCVTVCLALSGLLMLGVHDIVALGGGSTVGVAGGLTGGLTGGFTGDGANANISRWVLLALGGLAITATSVWGARQLVWPSFQSAFSRLDSSLTGHPLQALRDHQVVKSDDDAATRAVWAAHQSRMAQRLRGVRPVAPDLRISALDPFALRYLAVLTFVVPLIFGPVWQASTADRALAGAAQAAMVPSWEGWIEPPRYTRRPTIYLNDIDDPQITVPQGSKISLRFYGRAGDLSVHETVSGRIGDHTTAPDADQNFPVSHTGELRIDGITGQTWQVVVVPDSPPQIESTGVVGTIGTGVMTVPFSATDDYGIVSGQMRVSLDLAQVDRRYGLAVDPDGQTDALVALPMPVTGRRTQISETLAEDFSTHVWAHLPVRLTLQVDDALNQQNATQLISTHLPARRFFDPLAAAIIEQRRDLLWAKANGARVAQVLRAISHMPDDMFRTQTNALRLRTSIRRLEFLTEHGLSDIHQRAIAQKLWDLAVSVEEGEFSDALQRMRAAQDRLSEAMKNNATDQEIAELMQELRQATQDYMDQLSRQQQAQDPNDPNQPPSDQQMQLTQDDLQKMMDKIQDLMEQGRFAEAQQALQEFQDMMENMRMSQSEGQPSQGQQAMEGLADTLRDQQGLADDAFRELQEQFNPNAQSGQSQQNEGRNGGQGRGQSHDGQGQSGSDGGDGQSGSAQSGKAPSSGDQGATGDSGSAESGSAESGPAESGGTDFGDLADRQQSLRDELGRQRRELPTLDGSENQTLRESLDRAGRAMDNAEQSLRERDFAGAIDDQSRALEALREGMRALADQLAQQSQGEQQSGQGAQPGDRRGANRDPLGRDPGGNGPMGTEENLLQGDDVYRRARELLDEIRRRYGEGERPEVELEYLDRLLDRF